MIKLKIQFLLQLLIPTCLLAIGIKDNCDLKQTINNTQLSVITPNLLLNNNEQSLITLDTIVESTTNILESNTYKYLINILYATIFIMSFQNKYKYFINKKLVLINYKNIIFTYLKNQTKVFLNIFHITIHASQYFYKLISFSPPRLI